MTPAYRILFFNDHMVAAQRELVRRNDFRSDFVRQSCADSAIAHLRHALRLANQMQCAARKALCMRVLNWLRSDLRKSVSP
jgi:hypothetical protein